MTSPISFDELAQTIYTIGHSNRDFDALLSLLVTYDVKKLIDIRARPSSARFPQFNRDSIAISLDAKNIEYDWQGDAFGGFRGPADNSPNTALLKPSLRAFADHMMSQKFQTSLRSLMRDIALQPTALMCAEAKPENCHRQLICDYLVHKKFIVKHIVDRNYCREHSCHEQVRVDQDLLIYDKNTQQELW